MRGLVLAAAVFGVLSTTCQTEATPTRHAAVSNNPVQPHQELVSASDHATARSSSRKQRDAPPEQLIPDICRGC